MKQNEDRNHTAKVGKDAIPDGYHDVAPGKLAAVVTHLEMRACPAPRHDPDPAPGLLEHITQADPAWYRRLYTRVGMAYLWASRLLLDDDALKAILHDPAVGLYVMRAGGRDAGILELDFRAPRACELVFFGVERELLGLGAGRWLMNRAIELAWSAPIERFWLHTCTLDHRDAPEFYVRSGFTPYHRQVEIFDDPRVLGILARDTAPEIPIL